MANPHHLEVLRHGVKEWNRWRKDNVGLQPDLAGAPLREFILKDIDLRGANLQRVVLFGAKLRDADLREADLTEADLRRANIIKALLRDAKLLRANLSRADLRRADCRGADLTGANLEFANLVEVNFQKSKLSSCFVYGVAAWDVDLAGADQSDLLIVRTGQSKITVDNLEIAQFIHLLLNNSKVRDVIDTVGKKAVLILGRFTPGRKLVLDGIRTALREKGYLPILVDFDKPSTRDTLETVMTLAGLARFILADITEPKSVPQELVTIVHNLPSVPVQPILEMGSEPWGMYDNIKRYKSVLRILKYKNLQGLLADFDTRVIARAEMRARRQAGK
jgi:uncharacterized protein YjbI with pentapeptide repeats